MVGRLGRTPPTACSWVDQRGGSDGTPLYAGLTNRRKTYTTLGCSRIGQMVGVLNGRCWALCRPRQGFRADACWRARAQCPAPPRTRAA